jgi:importin-7
MRQGFHVRVFPTSLHKLNADFQMMIRFTQTKDDLLVIIEHLFPTLLAVGTDLASNAPSTSQEAPTMLHFILKAYKDSLTSRLSKHQQSQENLVPWGRLLFTVVQMQIPPEVVPLDEDEREKSEWWKAKKWAYAILCRLFNR